MIAVLFALMLPSATVEQREMENARSVHISVGGVWLSRFDLQSSPGVNLAVTHYLNRSLAIDYVNASYFFTYEQPQAIAIREATGYQSNREWPRLLVGIGGRYAFAYGKMLIEASSTVLHFVPEISAHVGGMITHTALRPAFDLGLGLRIHGGKHFTVALEYVFVGSIEGPGTRFIVGGMPKLSLGVVF